MAEKKYDKKILAQYLPLTTTNSFYNSDPSKTNYVSYFVKMEEDIPELEENAVDFSSRGNGLTKFLNSLQNVNQ